VTRAPVLFAGHGTPVHAIEDGPWPRALAAVRPALARPRAILAISSHWYVPGTFVTSNDRPPTIHDFSGFPRALYAVRYAAPGAPDLARRVAVLLGRGRAALRTDWGLDHGVWSPLVRLFPSADVPIVQLSVSSRLPPAGHLALGRALAPLRDDGVLLLGSGNVTHDLQHALEATARGERDPPGWARRFDAAIAAALEAGDDDALLAALETEDGRRAHPTPEHFLPLLYCAGAADAEDRVSFPVDGFDLASVSMRTVLWTPQDRA
jgi:4,5-DOPA dioxygenase extradiol